MGASDRQTRRCPPPSIPPFSPTQRWPARLSARRLKSPHAVRSVSPPSARRRDERTDEDGNAPRGIWRRDGRSERGERRDKVRSFGNSALKWWPRPRRTAAAHRRPRTPPRLARQLPSRPGVPRRLRSQPLQKPLPRGASRTTPCSRGLPPSDVRCYK